MTLSFIIQKRYLAEKVAEQEATGTFHERREYKPFWRTRIGGTYKWRHGGDAVFLCGRYKFAANIRNITIEETPEEYAQVAGKVCYNIECKFRQEEMEDLSTFLV